jgi:hypothetical protein
MNKEKWVSMFRGIGLDEDTMSKWHKLFESQHPEEHQEFLEWLKIPESEIKAIRSK